MTLTSPETAAANPVPSPAAGMRFRVGGMDCASCAHKIETAVRRIEGVTDVTVNVQGGAVGVRHDARWQGPAAVQRAIEALGYTASLDLPRPAQGAAAMPGPASGRSSGQTGERPWWRTPKGVMMLVAGVAVAAAFAAEWSGLGLGVWPFVVAMALGLIPVAWRAFQAARSGSVLTIEMLMTIAAAGALIIGAAEEAAMVVFLFSVGEFLEGVAAASARRSIQALSALAPVSALLIEGEGVREVAAASLTPGQRVLVRPGDRIPCDGLVRDGATSVDESPINGESVPRPKETGATVYAGTINLDAAIQVEATHSAEDNTIARVLRLVEEAQESKAPVERFIDNFARIYMPVVVGLALVVAIAPPLLGGAPWDVWIYRALALLLIACPCALVISTPAAVAAGLAVGARRGLLIKGGAVLEAVGALKTVAFDKTGTLTGGRPRVTDLAGVGVTAETALALAAALEAGSSHPIALAVLDAARDRGVPVRPATTSRAVGGKGVEGVVDGATLFLGSPRAAAERGMLDAVLDEKITALESGGKTVAVLCGAEGVLGLIAMRDEPRPDAREGLTRLNALGVRAIMLTGDNALAAKAIGADLGIEVHAALMPEGKAQIIRDLTAAGRGPVGKIGDGINDAPALAAASVGIAMGGGTAVALETADVALLNDRVSGVADLIGLSRATLSNVRVNVAVAVGSKLVFLVTTILGLTGMWIAIMADTGATVLVTLNALRLLRYRFPAAAVGARPAVRLAGEE